RGEPAPDLAGVQAVLCTSANGVRALARRSGERGIALFAVGEATAARARAEGFSHVESAGGDVDDLARLACERLAPQDGRLLHVAGSDVAGDLAGLLRDAGFATERVVLYEARPVAGLSPPTVAALRNGLVDFALFFSPRSSAIFARLTEQAGVGAGLRSVTAVAIGFATALIVFGVLVITGPFWAPAISPLFSAASAPSADAPLADRLAQLEAAQRDNQQKIDQTVAAAQKAAADSATSVRQLDR